MYLSGVIAASILIALSLLHLYWMFGGRWGIAAAIPEVEDKPLFRPPPLVIFLVAASLFTAALLVLGRTDPGMSFLPPWLYRWGTWSLAAVLFLRAIGDFRIAGFFKRVTGTRFAQWDTWLFSPLCLALALMIARVARA